MLPTDFKEIAPLIGGVIGAVATLLGVAVAGFFSLKLARLNAEAQARQKDRELRLEKLEELFFLFDKWQTHLSNVYLYYLRCYRGKLAYKDVLESVKGLTLLAPGEPQKYQMIMHIYFPKLRAEYSPVEQARKGLVPFLSDPGENKLSTQDFEKAQVAFEQACHAFKSCISSLAQSLTVGVNPST